jgi:cytochrome c
MRYLMPLAAVAIAVAAPSSAGDPATGAKIFADRCATCHVVVSPAGQKIVDGGDSGPNQFGLIGRRAGTMAGFADYGDTLVAAGKAGLAWSEAEIVAYLADPRAFLRDRTGDNAARSKMAYKLRDAQERADVAAYLATLR